MRSSSDLLIRFGSQITPPLPPPYGIFTAAVFHAIHIASAFTSSSVTPGWYRMPPFAGPRATLCCTRNPVNTLICPLSIFVGMETSSTRFGVRRIWRRPASSFRYSAAISNWICEMRYGFKSSRGAIRGTGCGAALATVAIYFLLIVGKSSLLRVLRPRA